MARRGVGGEPVGQRAQRVAGAARHELARQRHGVEHGAGEPAAAQPAQLGIDEADVEPRVVRHQHGVARERQEARSAGATPTLPARSCGRMPVRRVISAGSGTPGSTSRSNRLGQLEALDPHRADLDDAVGARPDARWSRGRPRRTRRRRAPGARGDHAASAISLPLRQASRASAAPPRRRSCAADRPAHGGCATAAGRRRRAPSVPAPRAGRRRAGRRSRGRAAYEHMFAYRPDNACKARPLSRKPPSGGARRPSAESSGNVRARSTPTTPDGGGLA